ncbi:Zinc finger protein 521 [Portunus trituberculatus]|uniref:Zinc finger protein 521 n=1 Tax=Portunus trituberculatus TaxID=210409 RepID=A0A5B7CWB0_PORTR|nr:Zinc finger protein 521 [Portunus trituberculatus]
MSKEYLKAWMPKLWPSLNLKPPLTPQRRKVSCLTHLDQNQKYQEGRPLTDILVNNSQAMHKPISKLVDEGFGLNSNPTKQQNTHLSLGTIPSQAQTIQPRFQTIKVTKAPVLFNNPQLLGHRNPTEKQPLTPNDVQGITCKEEPLETENSNPGTVLVKLKSKRRRRSTSTSKVVAVPCELCPAVFKTLTALRIHTKQKHTEKPKCPACNITRSTSRKIFQHQITAHKEKLRCRHYCLALFDTREELSAHHISVHNKDDTVMKCRHCGKNYPRGTYLEHLQDCIGEIKCKRVKTCPTCDRKFVDPTDYNHHIRTCESSSIKDDGENESPTASTSAENNQEEKQNLTNQLELDKMLEESSKSSEENQKLKEDKDSQLKTNQFKCRFCSKVFQCKDDGVDHMVKKRKRNEDDSDDKHVSKKRKTMTLRSKSLRSNSGIVRCTRCFMTFESTNEGVSHVLHAHKFKMTNVKEQALTCKMCGSKFKGAWWLCRHIVNHYCNLQMWNDLVPRDMVNALNTRNQCWICKCVLDKNYVGHTSKRNAYIGMLLTEHCKEEESKFDCSLCNQEFSTRNEFWQHMKLHLSKPSSDYTTQSDLIQKEKKENYECSDCSLHFKSENELYKHLAFHFLEYTNKGKLETDIMVEDHQSEETVQTEESSEDDEWLPPSIVKKRKAENKKLEESNDSVIKIEDHEILEDISEITIKSEDIGIDEM